MKKRGQTLVETLVALGILIIVFFTAFSLVTVSMKSARMAREKMEALGYAQDALEKLRNIRDTNLQYNKSHPFAPVPFDRDILPTGTTNATIRLEQNAAGNFFSVIDTNPQVINNFSRVINVVKSENTITVNTTVTWGNNGKIILASQLTDWRKP